MGTSQQALNFIFDTGYDQTAVEITGCDNCGDTIFETGSSTTFSYVIPLNSYTISFGYNDASSITLTGTDATDQICFTSLTNSCATNVPFVAVLSQENLDTEIDGIVGLSSGTDGLVTNLIMKYFTD
jgi:hypothetical protein